MPPLIYSVFAVLLGFCAGILSGLFGIGGGIIIVPALVFFFKLSQQSANATTLVALLLPVGILGVLRYYQDGKLGPEHIRWGLLLALGLFAGAYFGAKLASSLDENHLRKAFAILLFLVAIKMYFMKK